LFDKSLVFGRDLKTYYDDACNVVVNTAKKAGSKNACQIKSFVLATVIKPQKNTLFGKIFLCIPHKA